MNARQKAKKYKRELELLRAMTRNDNPYITVEPHRIETFRARQTYDTHGLYSPPTTDVLQSILMRMIADDPEFRKYVEFGTYADPGTGRITCEARIKVVDQRPHWKFTDEYRVKED